MCIFCVLACELARSETVALDAVPFQTYYGAAKDAFTILAPGIYTKCSPDSIYSARLVYMAM